MSDPAKSIQVEDVLSSIRRIVTDDTESAVNGHKAADPSERDDRLVLTPAQRVPQGLAVPPTDPVSEPLDLGAFRAERPERDPTDEPKPGDHGVAQTSPDIRDTTNATLVLQPAQRVKPGDPQGVAPDDTHVARPLALATHDPRAVEHAADDDSAVHPVKAQDETLPALPSDAETLPAPTTDTEPDDPAQVDPELLRALVAEIVQQELQGALGERITRNVRKLVRREINRAMTAKDSD